MREITVNKIKFVDSTGKPVGVLGFTGGDHLLSLELRRGGGCISLSITADGQSAVRLSDTRHSGCVSIGFNYTAGAGITVCDTKGVPRLSLGIDPTDELSIHIDPKKHDVRHKREKVDALIKKGSKKGKAAKDRRRVTNSQKTSKKGKKTRTYPSDKAYGNRKLRPRR
jgi:hypothetical protein